MKMNDPDGEKEGPPPEVKDLAHKIGHAISELTPDGTEFSCIITLPGKGSDEESQLVVATNQTPQGLMEAWHHLVESFDSASFTIEERKKNPERR